jgi:hypothetical protein
LAKSLSYLGNKTPKQTLSDRKKFHGVRLMCILRQQFKATPKAMRVFHFLLARIETWFACLKTSQIPFSQVPFSQVKGEHLFAHGQTLSFPSTTPSISIRIYIALKNRPSGEPPRSHFTASRLAGESQPKSDIFRLGAPGAAIKAPAGGASWVARHPRIFLVLCASAA